MIIIYRTGFVAHATGGAYVCVYIVYNVCIIQGWGQLHLNVINYN